MEEIHERDMGPWGGGGWLQHSFLKFTEKTLGLGYINFRLYIV